MKDGCVDLDVGPITRVFGEQLRELRCEHNLSILELSLRTGLSTATISRLETNQQGFSQPTLEKLALAFGHMPDAFYGIVKPRKVPVMASALDIADFIKSPPEDRAHWIQDSTVYAITTDPDAFAVKAVRKELIDSHIPPNSHFIVEPNAELKSGDIILVVWHNNLSIRKYIERQDCLVLQSNVANIEPILVFLKDRDRPDMYRVKQVVIDL